MADSFELMWAALAAIGRNSRTGGYRRGGWTPAEREATGWFADQCASRGLTLESDGVGNLVAWWTPTSPVGAALAAAPRVGVAADSSQTARRVGGDSSETGRGVGGDSSEAAPGEPSAPVGERGVVTGSHLDSVIDGGAFDGPLGVVSALAAVDLLRAEGFQPARPIGVAAFVEEEGSRFGMPCLGSRLAVGALAADRALALTDRSGTTLARALEWAGLDPAAVGPGGWTDRVATFVELHVEQGRDLVSRDAAVGVAGSIWPHGRYRFGFTGEANHAGTTLMSDRRDPMLTYAMTVLAANKQARLAGARATFGRVVVEPNGTNAIPSAVTAWLDARAADDATLSSLLEAISRQAAERAERDGTAVEVTAESVTPVVDFEPALRDRLAGVLDGAPVLSTGAGHDAGILAAAGIPSAMLFVRNPTGVSHSPAERAEMADCLAGVVALSAALRELAG